MTKSHISHNEKHSSAQAIVRQMEAMRNEQQSAELRRFFKTEAGEYGHGDEFLGIKVPDTRRIVRQHAAIAIEEVPCLLHSRWHEVRLCGLLLLVDKFEKLSTDRLTHDMEAIKRRDEIVEMYLRYASCANNWDLVDLSVYKILGHWLLLPTLLGDPQRQRPALYKRHKQTVLNRLAKSDNLWLQRMSIVCTWMPTHQGDPSYCLRYAEMHLLHPHDLMHKAVGWMLREMGKQVDMELLRVFLRRHHHHMPRTTLRYAIEKMPPEERKTWLAR